MSTGENFYQTLPVRSTNKKRLWVKDKNRRNKSTVDGWLSPVEGHSFSTIQHWWRADNILFLFFIIYPYIIQLKAQNKVGLIGWFDCKVNSKKMISIVFFIWQDSSFSVFLLCSSLVHAALWMLSLFHTCCTSISLPLSYPLFSFPFSPDCSVFYLSSRMYNPSYSNNLFSNLKPFEFSDDPTIWYLCLPQKIRFLYFLFPKPSFLTPLQSQCKAYFWTQFSDSQITSFLFRLVMDTFLNAIKDYHLQRLRDEPALHLVGDKENYQSFESFIFAYFENDLEHLLIYPILFCKNQTLLGRIWLFPNKFLTRSINSCARREWGANFRKRAIEWMDSFQGEFGLRFNFLWGAQRTKY